MIPSRALATSLASYAAGIGTYLMHGAILTHASPAAIITVDAPGLGVFLAGSGAWVILAFVVYWPAYHLLGRYTLGPVRIVSATVVTILIGATLATLALVGFRHPITLDTMRRAWTVYLYFGVASLVLLAGAGWSGAWPGASGDSRSASTTASAIGG